MIPLVLMIMILEPRHYTACPFSRGYITFYSLHHMNKKYVDISKKKEGGIASPL